MQQYSERLYYIENKVRYVIKVKVRTKQYLFNLNLSLTTQYVFIQVPRTLIDYNLKYKTFI